MNLLIVTPYYKQDRTIGSVRWTKLTERLAKNHHVIVVTQPINDMDDTVAINEEDGVTVARANQKTFYEKIAVKYFKAKTGDDWQTKVTVSQITGDSASLHESFVRRVKNRLGYGAMQLKAGSYANWICRKLILDGMKIDVVINSACPFIEMLFGYELKKRLGCKWICDFRDLPFLKDNSDDTRIAHKIMRQKLALADKILVVTKGCAELFHEFCPEHISRLQVVTNGFSLADRQEHTTINDGKLHIVYTGSLYNGRTNINLLLSAIQKLQGYYSDCPFVLDCAGGNQLPIINCADQYGLKSIVNDHGFLPRQDALKLQNSADLLLLLPGDNRIALPAKMFEYILCEKPILCFLPGTARNGETTEVIRELNLGLAVEEADGEQVVNEVADYLKMQLERKRSGQPLLFEPVKEKIQRYDHDSITEQIESILKEIV